jgi:hypothetical protein
MDWSARNAFDAFAGIWRRGLDGRDISYICRSVSISFQTGWMSRFKTGPSTMAGSTIVVCCHLSNRLPCAFGARSYGHFSSKRRPRPLPMYNPANHLQRHMCNFDSKLIQPRAGLPAASAQIAGRGAILRRNAWFVLLFCFNYCRKLYIFYAGSGSRFNKKPESQSPTTHGTKF